MEKEIRNASHIIPHYLASAVMYYRTGHRDYWNLMEFCNDYHTLIELCNGNKLKFKRWQIKGLLETPARVRVNDDIYIEVFSICLSRYSYEINFRLIICGKCAAVYSGDLSLYEGRSDYLLWNVTCQMKQKIRREDIDFINRWSWTVRNAKSYELTYIRLGTHPDL